MEMLGTFKTVGEEEPPAAAIPAVPEVGRRTGNGFMSTLKEPPLRLVQSSAASDQPYLLTGAGEWQGCCCTAHGQQCTYARVCPALVEPDAGCGEREADGAASLLDQIQDRHRRYLCHDFQGTSNEQKDCAKLCPHRQVCR